MVLRSGRSKSSMVPEKVNDGKNDVTLPPEQWKTFHNVLIHEIQSKYYNHHVLNSVASSTPLEITNLITEYASDGFKVGDFVDVLDKREVWCIAKVLRVSLKLSKIKVHYFGWSAEKFDVWISPDDGKVCKGFTHTHKPIYPTRSLSPNNSFVQRMQEDGFSKEDAEKFADFYSFQDCVNALVFAKYHEDHDKLN
jgi:hypothetical protein